MVVINQRSYGSGKRNFLLYFFACMAAIGGAGFYWGRNATGWESTAGFVLMLLGIIGMADALKGAIPWAQGEQGEKRTLEALQPLSDDYSAVTNVVIPGTKQGDIDLVLCGPFGAMAIEIKQYDARYVCENDNWFNVKENGYRKRSKSATRQAKKNAAALQKHLKAAGSPAHVYGVVVINDKARLDVNGSCVPVLRRSQLLDYVRGLPPGIAADPALVPLGDGAV